MMGNVVDRHMWEAPCFLRHEEDAEQANYAQRRPVRRLLVKLGVMLLIVLLLIGVAWVMPVASGAQGAQPQIAPSFVAHVTPSFDSAGCRSENHLLSQFGTAS
jgi:hypothetical protein